MAAFESELLDTARLLLERRLNQRGPLPAARIRRSISTSYYALFHFLSDQVATQIVGTGNKIRRRRHVFSRELTHTGVKSALDRVRGSKVEASVAEFFRTGPASSIPVPSPDFVRTMAGAFADAQAARHLADYDRNTLTIAANASKILDRVEEAIAEWKAANTPHDRDFKHAVSILIALKGKLRTDKV
jgi:hypothetical protein